MKVGERLGSRIIERIGRNKYRKKVVRVRCEVCGTAKDILASRADRPCGLCMRNRERSKGYERYS